jgi:hypothetical protein
LKFIMQLLRDNLTLWTSDMQAEGGDEGLSGDANGKKEKVEDVEAPAGDAPAS